VTPEAELHYHQILAGVIEEVLRCRSGPIRVPELANSAGFSRFHLARLFHRTTEETLEAFLRRIRLERAAYMLGHSDLSVLEISIDSGYLSPEAFSRAFKQSHGCLPSQFRKSGRNWQLPSPVDLHWNADWVILDKPGAPYGESLVSVPVRYACVWRALGNYSKLDQAWKRFQDEYSSSIPAGAVFVTIYLDNMWTHPVTATMRADIGWLCAPAFPPPKGMRRIVIPAGCYVASRMLARSERNDGWSYMCGRYYPPSARRATTFAYDEYDRIPIPFDQARTRILVGRP
jgi:AraC family transcriptional regulator